MKIPAAALTPATRACLAIAFGAHLPPDFILELEVYTGRDVANEGIAVVDEGSGVLALQAQVGEHTLSYGVRVPDVSIEKHVKNLLDETFLQLLMPDGVSTPDADALRRRLLFLRGE